MEKNRKEYHCCEESNNNIKLNEIILNIKMVK